MWRGGMLTESELVHAWAGAIPVGNVDKLSLWQPWQSEETEEYRRENIDLGS